MCQRYARGRAFRVRANYRHLKIYTSRQTHGVPNIEVREVDSHEMMIYIHPVTYGRRVSKQ